MTHTLYDAVSDVTGRFLHVDYASTDARQML